MMKGDPGALMYWAWNLGTQGIDYRKERDKAAGTGTITHALIDADLLEENAVVPGADDFEVTTEVYADMRKRADIGFKAYQDWRASSKLEIISAESPLVSEKYKFGGTPDAVARLNGALILLDWKAANAIYPEYIAQVAAYAKLWYENHNEYPESAVLLRVGKDEGDFHVSSWPANILQLGWEAFLHAHALYDLRAHLKKVC